MADGRHLEKSKIGHISAKVQPIGTKFGTLMHTGPLGWMDEKFAAKNTKMTQ